MFGHKINKKVRHVWTAHLHCSVTACQVLQLVCDPAHEERASSVRLVQLYCAIQALVYAAAWLTALLTAAESGNYHGLW